MLFIGLIAISNTLFNGIIGNQCQISRLPNQQESNFDYSSNEMEFPNRIDENMLAILEKIPVNEREKIEGFFREMVTNESMGYVIFGNKPMIWCGLYAKELFFNENHSWAFIANRSWINYLAWEKYQHLFPMLNYIFRIYEDDDNRNCYYLILINKKICITAIQKNINLFKQKLGDSISPEEIMHQLEVREDICKDVLKGNDDLLGILLGFGTHNSQVCQKMIDFLKDKDGLLFDKKKSIEFCWSRIDFFPSHL